MRSVRLLPIVIFAALALLVFKGFSLLTEGSYVLTGSGVAAALEETHARPEGEGEMSLPEQATLEDTSPMLEDKAPTLGEGEGGGHAAPAEGEHEAAPEGEGGASAAAEAEHTSEPPAEGDHAAPVEAAQGSSEAAADEGAAPVIPDIDCPAIGSLPAPEVEGHAEASGDAAPAHGEEPSAEPAEQAVPDGCPKVEIPTNAQGDALPTTKDSEGKIVPLAIAEGVDSEKAVLERLAARRDELDLREAELNMRLTLVEAAEKRIEERSAELHSLEAQIQALVDQRKAAEDEQFKGVVSMYEAMKPKDAARIFDTLDMRVLLRVAQTMNPRKLAPILAAMGSVPAETLTTALASVQPEPVVADVGENLSTLPQIVGQ